MVDGKRGGGSLAPKWTQRFTVGLPGAYHSRMRRRTLSTLGLALVLVSGCVGPFRGPTTESLSFAQMQSINPGVSASWLLSEYPFARDLRRRPDGSIAQMGYLVTDPLDDTRAVLLVFDGRGILTEKRYGGPIIRPPEQQAE